MVRSYVRLISLAVAASVGAPLLTYAASRAYALRSPVVPASVVLAAIAGLICVLGVHFLLMQSVPRIESAAERQAGFLLSLPAHYSRLAIFLSAAVSLFRIQLY